MLYVFGRACLQQALWFLMWNWSCVNNYHDKIIQSNWRCYRWHLKQLFNHFFSKLDLHKIFLVRTIVNGLDGKQLYATYLHIDYSWVMVCTVMWQYCAILLYVACKHVVTRRWKILIHSVARLGSYVVS